MQASDEMIKEWDSLKERGDTTKIASELGLKRSNTSVIINTGKGTVAQIAFIAKFYNARKVKVKSILNKKAA